MPEVDRQAENIEVSFFGYKDDRLKPISTPILQKAFRNVSGLLRRELSIEVPNISLRLGGNLQGAIATHYRGWKEICFEQNMCIDRASLCGLIGHEIYHLKTDNETISDVAAAFIANKVSMKPTDAHNIANTLFSLSKHLRLNSYHYRIVELDIMDTPKFLLAALESLAVIKGNIHFVETLMAESNFDVVGLLSSPNPQIKIFEEEKLKIANNLVKRDVTKEPEREIYCNLCDYIESESDKTFRQYEDFGKKLG